MKTYIRTLVKSIQIFFCFRRKVVYIGGTDNVNLGDNAQRLLLRKWCKTNYSGHRYIEISIGETACQPFGVSRYAILSLLSFILREEFPHKWHTYP